MERTVVPCAKILVIKPVGNVARARMDTGEVIVKRSVVLIAVKHVYRILGSVHLVKWGIGEKRVSINVVPIVKVHVIVRLGCVIFVLVKGNGETTAKRIVQVTVMESATKTLDSVWRVMLVTMEKPAIFLVQPTVITKNVSWTLESANNAQLICMVICAISLA